MVGYMLQGSLGQGGFGEVYVCTRDSDGAPFAMKVLLPEQDDDTVVRFRREDPSRILWKLSGWRNQPAEWLTTLRPYATFCHSFARNAGSCL